MKVFAPYLSKALLHRIDIAVAGAADYDRQYPDPNLKPPFAGLRLDSSGVTTSKPHRMVSTLRERNQRRMATFAYV